VDLQTYEKIMFPFVFVLLWFRKLKLQLKIKLSLFIVLISVFRASTLCTYAKDTQVISLKMKEVPIKEILKAIEKQTSFSFVYNSKLIDVEQRVTITISEKNINNILKVLFTGTDIDYEIIDKQILLSKRSINKKNSHQKIVRGKVIDDQGDPLPGVNIVVKGEPNIGTVTDIDGNYTITVPYPNATLIFSYVGFQPQEIKVNNRSTINVTLVEDTKALEEVVVVGYSTQKKETIVGSVATITTKDLKQSPTANINNALAGRMPGLMVNQFIGGEPGVDRADIYIRGFATTGDKSPIIIVDGVERDMSYLSAEEIETFTILKDASATAQYGVRGANGVIVVTTKRGKAQEKATVSFKATFGTNHPVKFPEYLGSADYATLYNEAVINDNPGIDPATLNLFSQQAIDNFKKAKGDNSDGLGYNWDYFDYAFKPGTQQDYCVVRTGRIKQEPAITYWQIISNKPETTNIRIWHSMTPKPYSNVITSELIWTWISTTIFISDWIWVHGLPIEMLREQRPAVSSTSQIHNLLICRSFSKKTIIRKTHIIMQKIRWVYFLATSFIGSISWENFPEMGI
jgi:TonB-dependent SusC/RagA subfamily outer membrane receptor